MVFSHLLIAAAVMLLALAASPPQNLTRFSRRAWTTGLAVGGALTCGMAGWLMIDSLIRMRSLRQPMI